MGWEIRRKKWGRKHLKKFLWSILDLRYEIFKRWESYWSVYVNKIKKLSAVKLMKKNQISRPNKDDSMQPTMCVNDAFLYSTHLIVKIRDVWKSLITWEGLFPSSINAARWEGSVNSVKLPEKSRNHSRGLKHSTQTLPYSYSKGEKPPLNPCPATTREGWLRIPLPPTKHKMSAEIQNTEDWTKKTSIVFK